jgi:hypothetical protein
MKHINVESNKLEISLAVGNLSIKVPFGCPAHLFCYGLFFFMNKINFPFFQIEN